MTAQVLFVGDIHLGRRPGHLPPSLQESDWSASDLGPAAVWRATVDLAIQQKVVAVVLAGDVVDCVEDRFEAAGLIESGLASLSDAGIPAFAVVGNHDVEALPRTADLVPGFRLLGRDGNWERLRVDTADQGFFYLLGWSFTHEKEVDNPVEKLSADTFEPRDALCLGVLHCDLGKQKSPYAPVPRRALDEGPAALADAWFLGHEHKPHDLAGPRPVGYLGSLTGLDPGEPGRHGPWLATLGGQRAIEVEQVALAALRWERTSLSVAGVEVDSARDAADELYRLLDAALSDMSGQLQAEATHLKAVGLRVTISGAAEQAPFWHAAIEAAQGDVASRPARSIEKCFYFIEKLVDEVRPAHDLADLARGNDPVGLLAQRLVALEALDERGRALVEQARERFDKLSASGSWIALDYEDREQPDTRELLLSAGYASLEKLLAQDREQSTEPNS